MSEERLRTEAMAGGSAQSTTPVTLAKANTGKRVGAFLIDAIILAVLGLIPFIGGFIVAVLWLLRDGIVALGYRSPGKAAFGLRVVSVDGRPMSIGASTRRNWMFALGAPVSILIFIPFIGWLLAAMLAVVTMGLAIVEIIKVLTDSEGRRLGDSIARTMVIEA